MFAATESLVSVPESLNAYFERSQELLYAIADVLDVRTVFPRLSEIAKRILPHNTLEAVARVTRRCSTVITGLLVSETQADR
jgi:hypothetical protein